mmetsp:Transcript_11455/g.13137  ORF Transcript_11455/g.13137 Transcript_11455/m.13137 type:complete len:227 (+) Transcript_11455:145-825(+)|eukprot:CAMPEP_0184063012 /NCGR_PEP_ID=MMETSP0957-20130417/563_1 /TAXON_ID=627963 /ORGANISM="Aplanochytrium sp, Strain PBS07" /LENGTH=226 /DNA_ID=CAMNT_0026359893 /DNA_START=145 /DNA_END=825 /DNA_ORIENTATION=-
MARQDVTSEMEVQNQENQSKENLQKRDNLEERKRPRDPFSEEIESKEEDNPQTDIPEVAFSNQASSHPKTAQTSETKQELTFYVIIDETRTINLKQLASESGYLYLSGKTEDFSAKSVLDTISTKADSELRPVLLDVSRLSLDELELLTSQASIFLVVVEKRINQPPLVEQSRRYTDAIRLRFGKELPIISVYTEEADTEQRQQSLATQSLEVVLDNPELNIQTVY